MNKLIIGITGSKTFENKVKIKTFIHKLREKTDAKIEIVSLGDRNGADKHTKKYALEFGYEYREMNPAHTPKNLYSLMTEAYYDKPYQAKNFFQQTKIYSQYIDKCVIFDDTNQQDKKVISVIKELTKAKKKAIIIVP
jgi:hypothetical protein